MKVHIHSDADGITSGVLFYKAMGDDSTPNLEIVFPEEFGGVDEWSNGDVMVDMKPVDPTIKGTVFDHHPDHPSEEDRDYELYWGDAPASLLIYNQYKHYIPVEDRWKVAVGLSGDGQPQKIPVEVWVQHPELSISFRNEYYGKTYETPAYMELSSLINSVCRLKEPEIAFNILLRAKSPLDILYNSELREKKSIVAKMVKDVKNKGTTISLPRNVILFVFESPYSLHGRIASSMSNLGTAIALNQYNGHFSVRGAMANLVKYILDQYPKDFHIGGHDGFLGGKILSDDMDLLTKVLVKEL
jgi:hypothetical protein